MLFIVVAVLVSVAVVPLLLSALPAPVATTSRKFGLGELYRTSPLGFVAMIGVGASMGALSTMGAVFLRNIGLTIAETSTLLAATTLGGMAMQWPIGQLSDRLDRRSVLTVVTLLAALVLSSILLLRIENTLWLTAIFFVFGGMCFPCIHCVSPTPTTISTARPWSALPAHWFSPAVSVSWSGRWRSVRLMQWTGPMAFVVGIAVIHAAIGIFAVYRSRQRPSVPMSDQGQHVYVPATPSPVVTTIVQEEAQEQS